MVSEPILAGRPRYLAFLPDFLFSPTGGTAWYIVRGWLLMLVPSLLLSFGIDWLFPGQEVPFSDAPRNHRAALFVALVFIGPFIETLVLAGVTTLLDRWLGAGPAVVGSALFWAAAHSWQVPMWGFVIWWPFLVMTVAFLAWRGRGFWTAVGVVTAMHGLQNSLPALAVVLG